MLTMEYKEPSTEVKIIVNEDDTLTLAFAKFVRMCEIIGYQDGSWENVLNPLKESNFTDLSVWAREIMFEEEAEF